MGTFRFAILPLLSSQVELLLLVVCIEIFRFSNIIRISFRGFSGGWRGAHSRLWLLKSKAFLYHCANHPLVLKKSGCHVPQKFLPAHGPSKEPKIPQRICSVTTDPPMVGNRTLSPAGSRLVETLNIKFIAAAQEESCVAKYFCFVSMKFGK